MQKIYSAYGGERAYPRTQGERTGMVFCPRRMGGIAVMRCGEYQEEFGCGPGCASRATAGQIREMRQRTKEKLNHEPRVTKGRDPFECRGCGRHTESLRKGGFCYLCSKQRHPSGRKIRSDKGKRREAYGPSL